jgi:hypothetical protein
MLERFRGHFDDKENGYFEQQKTKHGATIMISKHDYYCGEHSVPTYLTEFSVPDARPVDVFNVLADTMSQPEWMNKGMEVSLVKNDHHNRVQGFSVVQPSAPVARRQFYHWQAYEAKFDTEEFLVGDSARHGSELEELQPKEHDTVVGRTCYSFSRIHKVNGTTHVSQVTFFDAKFPMSVGPFSPRSLYHMVWPRLLDGIPKILDRVSEQAAKGWPANKVVVPEVYIGSGSSSGSEGEVGTVKGTDSKEGAEAYQNSKKRMVLFIVGMSCLGVCCTCLCAMMCFYCCCSKGGKDKQRQACGEAVTFHDDPDEPDEEKGYNPLTRHALCGGTGNEGVDDEEEAYE